MVFNEDKFQLLRYGGNDELKLLTNYKAPNGRDINEDFHVKDLGVLMSSDGFFMTHVENLTNDCNRKIGWILRTFHSRDILTMKTLFKSLVLSRVDYCSPLIHPTLNAATTIKIEDIQRAFTRKISNMKSHSYWERLKLLGMHSIERRRERFIIIYMFKILNNLVPNPGVHFKDSMRNGITANVPLVPTNRPTIYKSLRYHHFNFIGPKLFNILPPDLRCFSTDSDNVVLAFKNKLDTFLSRIPDQPTTYGMQRQATSNSLFDQQYYISNA